jgi:hypothetical protein
MMTRSLCLAGLLAVSLGAFAADEAKPASDKPAAQPTHSSCLKETGSRIKPKDGQCINAPGTSVSHEELQMTGEVSTSRALSRQVPSLTSSP